MTDIKVVSTSKLSPQSEALFEVGKKMLTDSIEVGRDFAKFMMTLSSSSIPVYIGILTFINKDSIQEYSFSYYIPPIAFLVTIIIFSISFFPQYGKYSIDVIEEIKAAREKAINSRNWLFFSGFIIFIFGLLFAILIISKNNYSPKLKDKITSLYLNINTDKNNIENKIKEFQKRVDSLSYHSKYTLQEVKNDSGIILIAKYQTLK